MLIELIKKIIIVVLCLTGLIGCVGEQRPLANGSIQPAQEATGANPDSVQEAGNDQGQGGSAGPTATSGGAVGSTAETAPVHTSPTQTPNAPSSPESERDRTIQSPPSPATSISFQGDIRPLFETHCMLCHAAAPPVIQWTEYDESMQYVRNGTLLERIWTLRDDPVKAMPLGNVNGMTEEERELIKNWIEGDASP